MKNVLFAGLAVAALATTPVLAADMPIKGPPRAAPVYNWTGCYVGSSVGGYWGDTNWSDPAGDPTGFVTNQKVHIHSYTSGGQIGCNFQATAAVVCFREFMG